MLLMTEAIQAPPETRRRCAVCLAHDQRPTFRGLVQCARCGVIFYPHGLAPHEAEALYSEDYFSGQEYLDYLSDRTVHRMNFRARARGLRRFLPRGSTLFEIGCAYGLFLEVAHRDWTVSGCDISHDACRYGRDVLGLDVQQGDFLDLDLEPGAVDAFVLWDTIEHLDDPAACLERAYELLPPGGILALTTGDIGSALARRQGPRWRQIHPPTHLWYFSQATISQMLSRIGFEIERVRSPGLWRSLGQIVYSLASLGKPGPSALYRFCTRVGLARVPVWMQTFDLMFVVARKPGGAP